MILSACWSAIGASEIVGDTEVRALAHFQGESHATLKEPTVRLGNDFHIRVTGLPSGKQLQLELGFVEHEYRQAGQRTFDLLVNNRRALSDFDIFQEAGAVNTLVTRKFSITPPDDSLDFHFIAQNSQASISFIRISGNGVNEMIVAPPPRIAPELDQNIPADQLADYDVESGVIHLDGSAQTWSDGVPIGGIGTGKFTILPNGQFANFTVNNSWDLPVVRPQGTFLAVAAKAISRGGVARIMQVNPTSPVENHKPRKHPYFNDVKFSGQFPFANWEFKDKDIHLNISVEAWSPLVPNDVKDSALPGGVINVIVENPKSYPVATAIAFSWEDLNGRGGSLLPGDQHSFNAQSTHKDAATSNVTGFQIVPGASEGRNSTFHGDYFVGTTVKGAIITRKLNWNPRGETIPWWKDFATKLRLDKIPDTPASVPSDNKTGPAASTLCVSFNLAPKEKRRIPFIVAWNMPQIQTLDSKEVPNYVEHFDSSAGVASYIAANRPQLRKDTREWTDMVDRSSVPRWIKQHTLNSLYPVKTNSILLKNQRFTMLESPTDRKGMLGPVDLRQAEGDFLRSFFPELDKTELNLYARAQDASGRIPRYVGNIHGALSGFNTDLLGQDWVDPTASWILQVAAYWRETGDDEFLQSLKPALTKARDYVVANYSDSNRLNTTTAYSVADKFVGGGQMVKLNTALALRASGILLEDSTAETEALARRLADEAKASALDAPFSTILAGHYTALQAGVQPIYSESDIQAILEAVHDRNFATMKPVPVMEIGDGSDAYSYPAVLQSFVGYPALKAGSLNTGLEPYLRMFQINYAAQKAPWRQFLRYSAPSAAQASVRYHRSSLAAWSLWRALSGIVLDVPNNRLYLNPQTILGDTIEMEIPVFTPAFHGWLKFYGEDSTGTLTVTRTFQEETTLTIRTIATGLEPNGSAQNLVELPEPFELVNGATLYLDGWPRKPDGVISLRDEDVLQDTSTSSPTLELESPDPNGVSSVTGTSTTTELEEEFQGEELPAEKISPDN